jgi:hypothetical protein
MHPFCLGRKWNGEASEGPESVFKLAPPEPGLFTVLPGRIMNAAIFGWRPCGWHPRPMRLCQPQMRDAPDTSEPTMTQDTPANDTPAGDTPASGGAGASLPDRLSVNPRSPHFNGEALQREVGIRFNGKERFDVEEYCISEGWIRVAAGKSKDRFGQPLTIKLNGVVEAWHK